MIGAVGYKVITLNRNQKELLQTMNTFTKKSLHVALAGLGTLAMAGAADAVMVNPNGLGQVLIYPYYTVRSPAGVGVANYNTLLSIVNTTASQKAVKVRFREGKASKEVLDFNVFLTPKDMWTAAVEPDGAGGAQIETSDRTCTIPSFTPNVPVAFRTGAYEGDGVGDDSVDRLTEGYFEVFEMATYDSGDPLSIGAKHSGGVPKDCGAVTDASAAASPFPPNGGLFGGATLINVLTGDAFTEDATALINFTDTATYFTTGDAGPNWTQTSPAVGVAVAADGDILSGFFNTGILDPEKASTMALQKQSVNNEFVGEASTLSGTDWVLTFPTKHQFVDELGFTPPFSNKLTKVGSCDNATLATWDREETPVTPGGPDFSPSPTPTGFALCWETNIISFKSSLGSGIANVLGSANSYTVTTGFTNGWAQLTYSPTAFNISTTATGYTGETGTTFTPSTTFNGLPTIGFAVQTFVNGTLTDSGGHLIQSSYGGNFGHRYTGPQ
jgi:hypothetical protein